jgi:hypothetical protein
MLSLSKNRNKNFSSKLVFGATLSTLILFLIVLGFPTFYATYFNFKHPNAAKLWFPPPIELWNRGIDQAIEQIHLGFLNTLYAKEVPSKSSISTIKILLPDNTFDRFNREIFLYGFGYKRKKPFSKALAKTQDKTPFLRATVKMRGVHNDHHQIWKPSLKISYKKRKFPEGFKNHVLIAPRDGIGLQNWITDLLGQKLNLMTPGEHFVRLFINKKYFGLYTRVWRLDESLLINADKLPGPFFRMEYLIDRKYQRFYGGWNKPDTWSIKGVEQKEGVKMIEQVVGLIESITYKTLGLDQIRKKLKEYSEHLNMYIDQKSFANFLAILCYAGETHVDDIHNNAFGMDPVSGKLNPILIDTGGMSIEKKYLKRPITKQRGAFIYPWLLNPINFSIYIDHLYELINTIGSLENIKPLILDKWEEIKPHAVSDILASKPGCSGRCFVGINRLDNIVSDLIKFIELRTNWIKEQLFLDQLMLINQLENEFLIYIEGFSGIKIRKKGGNFFQINGSKDPSHFYNLLPSMPIIPKRMLKIKVPEAYAFFSVPGKPDDYVFTHRLTGNKIDFTALDRDFKTLITLKGINSLNFSEQPDSNPIKLGPGTITFKETKVFNKNQLVVINAGTNIFLGPNVSLIIQGPLKIEGTKAKPVSIRPINPKKPFGVLAVLGKETSGSQIDYLNIEGGSVDRHYNLNLTGMFSVHDNSDIEVSNSHFAKNFIGDDMLHFMRSNIKIKNSVFEKARADAIDFDLVDGEISNIIVKNSGNDGLDISMGTVRILNSHFEKSGDKCISAGEGTKTIILNSKFKQCNIGIAVKDRSQVKLTNNLFSENKIAYNTYRKKWRWEKGGEGIIKDTLFVNSINTDIKGDKFSKVSFINSIPKNIKIEGKLQLSSNFKG